MLDLEKNLRIMTSPVFSIFRNQYQDLAQNLPISDFLTHCLYFWILSGASMQKLWATRIFERLRFRIYIFKTKNAQIEDVCQQLLSQDSAYFLAKYKHQQWLTEGNQWVKMGEKKKENKVKWMALDWNSQENRPRGRPKFTKKGSILNKKKFQNLCYFR